MSSSWELLVGQKNDMVGPHFDNGGYFDGGGHLGDGGGQLV